MMFLTTVTVILLPTVFSATKTAAPSAVTKATKSNLSHHQRMGICEDKGGRIRMHGSVWQEEPCVRCSCTQNQIRCLRIKCSENPNRCRKGERMERKEGECCPKCTPAKGMCNYEGHHYEDGITWRSAPDTLCKCRMGIAVCNNDDPIGDPNAIAADEPQKSPSKLTSEAGFTLTVVSGEPAVISTHYLWYNKSQTEDDSDIIFTIVRRLSPADGRLLIAGYPQTNEVTSFSQKDIITESVIYIPPVTLVGTTFSLQFVVWKYPERVNLTGEVSLIVRVLPSENKEPEFETQNPTLRMKKGGSACISRDYFNVDISERNLRYVIVEAPNYGTLKFFFENGSTIDIFQGFEFGPNVLHAGSMCYNHVWRNKFEDYFEILATDSRMEAVNEFHISIRDEERVRDIKPTIIFEGERIALTSDRFGIQTTEEEIHSENIKYQLLAPPIYGHLYSEELGGRQMIPLDVQATFEEEDIEEGRLIYRAPVEIGSENLTETLRFSVKSRFNEERIDEVHIPVFILPVDNQPPMLVVNGHVVVGEGSEETLPFSLLTITDVDTSEEDLLVEIVGKPFFGEVRAFGGSSEPKPVNWFSVQELRDGKVSYSQSYNSRVEPVEDVILVRASDGKQRSQLARVNVSIELKNDEPPELLTSVLHVESGLGGRVVIDDSVIYVQDADTDAREITVTITRLPTQGVLRRREFEWRAAGSGHSLSANHSLTYAELLEGLLTYSTAFGAQETEDSFEFRVSDGEFSVMGLISIVIASQEPADKPSNWKTTSIGNGSNNHRDDGDSSSTHSDRALESRAGTTAFEIPRHRGPSTVLPYRPHVASGAEIEGSDDRRDRHPGPGSPLICILPCHPRHPLYASKRRVCRESPHPEDRVNFSWEVSVPLDIRRNSYLPFEPLTESTLFSDVHSSTLDPLYFSRGFRVRCVAATEGGGIPLKSDYVTVDGSPKCSSDKSRLDEPYSATLSYIEPTDSNHPNTFSVKLSVRHEDGMVPLVSTHPLTDPQLLLSLDLPFRSQHTCSNLNPGKGFVEDPQPIRESGSPVTEEDEESNRRREILVALDRHLDLEECIWKFEGWFGMGTLVDECGGRVVPDQKIDKEGQRYLTLQVPLHISLVFAAGASKWAITEYRTMMEFSMRYSSILWNKGFHTELLPHGRIQTTNTAVDDAGRLALVLRTETLFKGSFLLHGKHTLVSTALPPLNLRTVIKLTLELLSTKYLSDTSEQVWKITSDVAIDDYTGEYNLHLIPCMQLQSKSPSSDNGTEGSCIMLSSPIKIPFWVRFKQVGRPQPAAYSLQTEFVLTKQPPLHLVRDEVPHGLQSEEPSPEAYLPGDDIYGLVMWHPSQDLTNMYHLSIQRLYLCSGKQGLIPSYDPTGEIYGKGPQYGCIQPSKKLRYRFVLLDMQSHENMENGYNGINFKVFLAKEIAAFKNILAYSGVDGFAMKVDPLFEINAGLQWYLQVLYSISSKNDRTRRSVENADKNGQISTLNSTKIELQTNMKQILLDTKHFKLIVKEKTRMHIAVLVGISLLLLVILSIYLMKKKTNQTQFYARPEFHSANSNNFEQNEPLNAEITNEDKIEDKMKVALVTENIMKQKQSVKE